MELELSSQKGNAFLDSLLMALLVGKAKNGPWSIDMKENIKMGVESKGVYWEISWPTEEPLKMICLMEKAFWLWKMKAAMKDSLRKESSKERVD